MNVLLIRTCNVVQMYCFSGHLFTCPVKITVQQTEGLFRQMAILAGHCWLTGRYFEPCTIYTTLCTCALIAPLSLPCISLEGH